MESRTWYETCNSITTHNIFDLQICSLILKWHKQRVIAKKSCISTSILSSCCWMIGSYWKLIQIRGIFSNCSIEDVRNRLRFSSPSMSSKNGTTSLREFSDLWQMQSLTASYMIVITLISQELMSNMPFHCVRYMLRQKIMRVKSYKMIFSSKTSNF